MVMGFEMEERPIRFSVICPVYNGEAYLEEAILSVLRQSCTSWELILVDDGSTDAGPAIAERYAEADGRIRLIRTKHAGTYYARKTGIIEAGGEYLVFLDSDDLLEEIMLESLSRNLEETPADAAVFNWDRMDGDGKLCPAEDPMIMRKEKTVGSRSIMERLYVREKIGDTLCRAAFKSNLFAGVWNENPASARSAEDTYMAFHLFSGAETVLLIPEILYHYRINPASVTQNMTPEDYLGRSRTHAYLYDYIGRNYPLLAHSRANPFTLEGFLSYPIQAPQFLHNKEQFGAYRENCAMLRAAEFYEKHLRSVRTGRPKLDLINRLFGHRMYYVLFHMLRSWAVLLQRTGRRSSA